MLCPSDTGVFSIRSPDYDTTGQPFPVNYGANHSILHVTSFATGGSYGYTSPTLALARIKYPAETLIIADADWTRSTEDHSTSNAWRLYNPFHPSFFIPARHNGGANLAFADGHAKWWVLAINDIYGVQIKYSLAPMDFCWTANGWPKYASTKGE